MKNCILCVRALLTVLQCVLFWVASKFWKYDFDSDFYGIAQTLASFLAQPLPYLYRWDLTSGSTVTITLTWFTNPGLWRAFWIWRSARVRAPVSKRVAYDLSAYFHIIVWICLNFDFFTGDFCWLGVETVLTALYTGLRCTWKHWLSALSLLDCTVVLFTSVFVWCQKKHLFTRTGRLCVLQAYFVK